jgi:hypothetical protein
MAISTASGTSSSARTGAAMQAISVKLTACRVCPEGKLNRSSGRPAQMIELWVMNGRSRTRMLLSLR